MYPVQHVGLFGREFVRTKVVMYSHVKKPFDLVVSVPGWLLSTMIEGGATFKPKPLNYTCSCATFKPSLLCEPQLINTCCMQTTDVICNLSDM